MVAAVSLLRAVESLMLRVSGHGRSGSLATPSPTCGRRRGELIAENGLLRQQLIAAKRHLGRPQLARPQELEITLWADLTTQWQSTLLLFQPDTVLRRDREMFRIVWWNKSRPKGNSGAKLDRKTVKLITEMAKNNRTWGAERIRMARKGTSPGGQAW